MINALHSSLPGGTKQQFGWKAIVDIFDRECQCVRNGNAQIVLKLHEAHIIHDSRIKLNVVLAKLCRYVRMLPCM